MGQNENYCKQCLIRDMADHADAKSIQQYVDRIDADLRTPELLYEKRLQECKNCEQLLSGMCRVCGCFVEVRAAVNHNYCPSVQKRW